LKNKRKLPDWILNMIFLVEENKKGILFLIPILLFFWLLMLPYDKVKSFFYSYECVTEPRSWSITANEGISHSLEGSSIETHSYTVEYSYVIDGLSYKESVILPYNPSNNSLIKALQENNKSSIIIKYNCDNPYRSILTFASN